MAAQGTDWRAGRSSAEQLIHMLDTGALSDCTFRVGHPDTPQEIREFQLHRMILSKASAVWERMLLPGAPHMREADTGSVHITDISPSTFHIVLRQVYGDEAALTTLSYPEVQDVLQVADRYQISTLVSACEARICQGELITPDTVWSALSLVDSLHGLDRTRGACVKVLCSRTAECLESPGFLTSSESGVQLLLSQEALSLGSEFTLVCAVLRWARAALSGPEEPKRARLGPDPLPDPAHATTRSMLLPRLLPLLRLAACSTQELHTIISLSDWLTEEEVQALEAGDVSQFPPTLSRGQHRHVFTAAPPLPPGSTTPHRALVATRRPSYKDQGYIELCQLKVNRELWLTGFTVPAQTKTDRIRSLDCNSEHASDQYMEDLDIAIYQMKLGDRVWNRDNLCISKLTFKHKAATSFDSKISIILPSPVLMRADSSKIIIEVKFGSGGSYPINELVNSVRSGLTEFEFMRALLWYDDSRVRHVYYNYNFVESVSFTSPGALPVPQ